MRGLVRMGRGDDAELIEADLRESIELLDAFGARTLRGQAEEALGRWLVSQGRDAEGHAVLDRARATYQDIGARGWLARLEASYPRAMTTEGLAAT
jgi:hypothetical protein